MGVMVVLAIVGLGGCRNQFTPRSAQRQNIFIYGAWAKDSVSAFGETSSWTWSGGRESGEPSNIYNNWNIEVELKKYGVSHARRWCDGIAEHATCTVTEYSESNSKCRFYQEGYSEARSAYGSWLHSAQPNLWAKGCP